MSDFRLLEDRKEHALVMRGGQVELLPWSPLNRLVYKHDLAGLLVDGDETLILDDPDDHPNRPIVIEPSDDASEFTFHYGVDEFPIGQHEKSDLIEVLEDAIEQGDDSMAREPFEAWATELMDTKVNPAVARKFLPAFDALDADVEAVSKGWLFNDHLLLTFDNEFYHPDTTRVSSSGNVVGDGANKIAYDLRFREGGQRELDEFDAIGESDDLVEFLARAFWAATYSPEEVTSKV